MPLEAPSSRPLTSARPQFRDHAPQDRWQALHFNTEVRNPGDTGHHTRRWQWMKRAGRGVSEGNHGDKTLVHRCNNMKTKVSLSTSSPAQPVVCVLNVKEDLKVFVGEDWVCYISKVQTSGLQRGLSRQIVPAKQSSHLSCGFHSPHTSPCLLSPLMLTAYTQVLCFSL